MDLEPILKRLEGVERRNGEFAQAIKDLRDTVSVMAEIQRRQAEVQRIQAEGLATHEDRMRRVEANLAEISDKLNGLIGYIDNLPRQGPPPTGPG